MLSSNGNLQQEARKVWPLQEHHVEPQHCFASKEHGATTDEHPACKSCAVWVHLPKNGTFHVLWQDIQKGGETTVCPQSRVAVCIGTSGASSRCSLQCQIKGVS